jgi:hypothetical protein
MFYVKTKSFSHCENISTTIIDKIKSRSDMYYTLAFQYIVTVYQAWNHKSCVLSSLSPVRIFFFLLLSMPCFSKYNWVQRDLILPFYSKNMKKKLMLICMFYVK